MCAKPKNRINIVYSTNPDFQYELERKATQETLPPSAQQLRVMLDKKSRAGKQVTLIAGFVGTAEDLKCLEKKLKNLCGTGGSSKENEIIIQGDFRDKILQFLVKEGYKAKKG